MEGGSFTFIVQLIKNVLLIIYNEEIFQYR